MTNTPINTKEILPTWQQRWNEITKAYRERNRKRKETIERMTRMINGVLKEKKKELSRLDSVVIESQHAPLNVLAEIVQIYKEQGWFIQIYPYYSLDEEMKGEFEGKRLPERYLLEFSDIEVKNANLSK